MVMKFNKNTFKTRWFIKARRKCDVRCICLKRGIYNTPTTTSVIGGIIPTIVTKAFIATNLNNIITNIGGKPGLSDA